MLAKRIIPCLDCDLTVPEGRVVKGKRFKEIVHAGVPWKLALQYYEEGADEITILDITASHERRETMTHVIEKTVENVFVPITVGGGIRDVVTAKRAFDAGADKVSVNTQALKRPELITEIAQHFGNQACVVAIDCKRNYAPANGVNLFMEGEKRFWYECVIYGGREPTGIDAVNWAINCERRGAGEILLTSMDQDGTKEGYDLTITESVASKLRIPVIASGGAGSVEHIRQALTVGKADAALLAGLLHFKKATVAEIKHALKDDVPMRV